MPIYKDFILGEMFEIATGRDLLIKNTTNGNIPLISNKNTNNGVVKYISQISDRRIFDHRKTIALADRGVFFATVQCHDFHIGTRVKALTLKGDIQQKEVYYSLLLQSINFKYYSLIILQMLQTSFHHYQSSFLYVLMQKVQ